jgi:acyl-coenzyme A synthetase/AMP-(fatty) acid ligase
MTAEPSGSLADILIEHPFADDEGLLLTPERGVTAGEAKAAARAFAQQLAEAGVRTHQAVAVQLPNAPEFVTTMFGCWLAHVVFVPVNVRAPAAEVDEMLAATGCAALVTGVSTIERRGGDRVYADDVAFVMWTSGTTGRPKPILHTHSAYVELLDRMLAPLRAGPRDPDRRPAPNLIPVALALNAGLYNVLFGLRVGAAVVIMESFEPGAFAAAVAQFAIRSTILPPAAITELNDAPDVTDLTPLRYLRSLTAPLSPLQARRFTDKFGVVVLNGYGQAEMGEVIGWTAADAKEHPDKIGAAGRPHPGVDVRVVADEGQPVPPGEVGRLLVRPPRMAAGYADGAELGERVDADGFVDTGDFARVDPDGFVWLEGRAGDMINRGGNKVFPDQVEEVLRLAPTVRDAAVVGLPDDRLGEVPVAFLVGEPVPDDELERLCRGHLVPYKVPVAYHWVAELPRSEAGKVLRRELAARVTR